MRLIKVLGPTAIAALAAMAFIASSASADSLCEENVGHGKECPKEIRVEEGKLIEGLTISPAILLNEAGETKVECHSKVLGKVGKNGGAHTDLVVLIESMTYTNCKGECETAKAENLPYNLLALALKLHALISEDGKGRPAVLLEGCSLLGLPKLFSCLYEVGAPEAALLDIEGDKLIAKKVPLKAKAELSLNHSLLCVIFLCPLKGLLCLENNGTWDATYLVTLDNGKNNEPVYITGLP